MKFKFVSKIKTMYLEDLESLLYFNKEQRKVISGIESSIEKYGLPQIKIEEENLGITIEKIKEPQVIYILNDMDTLLGLIIFYRETKENIVILHIAIKEQFTMSSNNKFSAAIALIEELKNKAKRIKGITTLSIYYKRDTIGKIKV